MKGVVSWLGKQRFRILYAYSTFSILGWGLILTDIISRWFTLEKEIVIGLVVCGIGVTWFIGFLMDKAGMLSGEQSYLMSKMTQIDSIEKRLDRIELLLEGLK